MKLREPLLGPACALATGVLLSHLLFFGQRDLILPGVLALIVLVVASRDANLVKWRWVAVAILCCELGISTELLHRDTRTPKISAEDGEVVLLSGCVVNPPVFSPGREQFTLQLAPRINARLSVLLKEGEKLPLRYGELVEAGAKIRAPRNFQNPDAFDFVTYLRRQDIFWNGSVRQLGDVHVMAGRCGWRAAAWIFDVRTWALERLARLYKGDQETTGLLQATLIGETAGVERRWTQNFRATGTYHALVISGLHISMLALTLLMVLRLIQVPRIPAICIAAAASWLYAAMAGFDAPAVRAAGAFTLFLVASYCFRRTRMLNILALVGVVYLVLDPDQLFDPSFQLSFLSAAVIAVFAIPLMERFTVPLRAAVKHFDEVSYDPQVELRAAQCRVELRLIAQTLQCWTGVRDERVGWVVANCTRLTAIVADAVLVSACVQLGLALPMIAYFHRLSLTGLTANAVIVPLLMLVIPLGFASIATGWQVLAVPTAWLLKCSERIADWHMRFEPAWRMGAVPVWAAVGFSGALIVLAIAIRYRRRWAIRAGLGITAFFFGLLCIQPWGAEVRPGVLELTAIDVSQGDSLFVSFPDGETMLIDAGGFPGMERMARKPQLDMGEDVVSPYLWSRRIHHLDYAALTHGHSDHMAGLPAVLDNFAPQKLWIGGEPDSAEWRGVKAHAAGSGTRIVALHRGSPDIYIGGVRIRVLAPGPDYVAGEMAVNDDSLVLEMTYGKRSILLTGDAEKPVEDELVESGALRPVTVLKVGHHGSKTSSSEAFLSALSPKLAIISDGYNNQFHHPHPTVLERLAEHRAAVFRTDQRGLVTFQTDGDKVEIHSFR